ncbi:beta-lactamase family protein [Candidatus Sumerlaeota bacterium]|nr:beta-lactamase family protein [Candidatus Sumerlaeota bacterium]
MLPALLWSRPAVADSDAQLVKPEHVGLSSKRLERIDKLMKRYVNEKRISGALGLIARHGEVVYLNTWGESDREAGKPMTPDTIFRIYSMSKPITSVAVMILHEEGRFMLTDPVAKFLPELANMTVMTEDADPSSGGSVVREFAASNPITIQDLLRHTAGLTYGLFGNTRVDQMYRERGVLLEDRDIAETVAKLGKLPLLFEPGTTWHYSVAVDVLGRLIEVVSGQGFDEFLKQRIFDPLEMNDTGFFVPPEKLDRFAQLYAPKGTQQDAEAWLRGVTSVDEIVPADPSVSDGFVRPPTHQSGGGGMVSTAGDYLRFCQLMLNGGELEGVRILSRKSVELMTTDHLGDIPMGLGRTGYGFGLGFAVAVDQGQIGTLGSVGEYNWGGAAGTRFWVDPKEDLIGIFMVQIIPHTGLNFGTEFKLLTYQAIAD